MKDYLKLYAPVACNEFVMLLTSIGIALGWDKDHVDVVGALLNALLPVTEKFLIRLPTVDGFTDF